MNDLHILPKVRESWSYLYLEHGRIDRHDKAIAFHDARGLVPIPCASLMMLMLGPGTTVTHGAVQALADNGCLVAWVGEHGVRFYAHGSGETRSAARLMRQARWWADPVRHQQVVRRLYGFRFSEPIPEELTLQQVRGMEGVRVREAYARASRLTGVPWSGRSYKRREWGAADPVNRALSAANSCLYGVCQAAVVALGYATGLGFIHTGKVLSFVYDVADLYKANVTVPLAFATVAESTSDVESRARLRLRDAFAQKKLLSQIVDDLVRLFDGDDDVTEFDGDAALPGDLWGTEGAVAGGVNWGETSQEGE